MYKEFVPKKQHKRSGLLGFLKNEDNMKSYRLTFFRAMLTVAIGILSAVTVHADVEKFHGKAVNSDGEVIFFEEHTLRYENNQIASMNTIYYDANLKKIGELVSDFSQNSHLGSYDFRDDRLRYIDGAKVMQDQILIYSKKTPEAGIQEKYIRREPGQIVGQGLHSFILENLDVLAKGEIIPFKLVLPAQMDQFNIRIRKSNLEDDRIVLRIELDNWFLRLFASHIQVEYDMDTRQLLSYQGVSVVADESGKTVPVTISYAYSQSDFLLGGRMETEASLQSSN
ncbi:MAG: hypothetical protein PVF38_12925 [Desulfobacterales bacterium]